MKSELSSIEIGVVVNELEGLFGAKIAKIYQQNEKNVVLFMHKPGVGKLKVRLMAPTALFLTRSDFEFPEKPPGFCLQLRKHLDGARLTSVLQVGSERIVEFRFDSGRYRLIVELFSKGNIILCNEDYSIISVAERQLWSSRKIIPGETYAFPLKKCDFYSVSEGELLGLLSSSNKDSLVKALAMDLGLGGVYSEEVCLISGANKNTPPVMVDRAICRSIICSIQELVGRGRQPAVVYDGSSAFNCIPFMLKVYEGKVLRQFESYCDALDFYYCNEFRPLSRQEVRIGEIRRIIGEQESMISRILDEIDGNRQKGDLIYANYQLVKEVIDEIGKARKAHSWAEIRRRLSGHGIIKDVDESVAAVVIELGDQ